MSEIEEMAPAMAFEMEDKPASGTRRPVPTEFQPSVSGHQPETAVVVSGGSGGETDGNR